MKKLLLLGAAATMVVASASAFGAERVIQTPIIHGQAVQAVNVLESQVLPLGDGMMQVCTDSKGRQFKRIVKLNDQGVKKVAVSTPSTIGASRADVECLAESFETGEMPENWSTYSDEECTEPQPWRVDTPFMVSGADGDFACYSGSTWDFGSTYDEWLFTPSFEVKEDYVLSYLGAQDLIWMVNSLYLQEDGTFSEYVPAGVLKIWAVDVASGEKTLIHDFFEDVIGMTWSDLFDAYTGNFAPYSFPLSDFVGKEIKIAFENVGANGNSIYIDKVVVDVPQAEASYDYPDWTLFWGLDRGFRGLNLEVAVMPVYEPLTWTAKSEIEGASFIWDYYNNASQNDFGFGDTLTETYTPDYSSTFSTNTNLFYSPTLYCAADGYSLGIYSIYDYFQAGGRPDFYQSNSDSFINFLMHCSCHSTEGFTNIGTGKTGIPAFGYGVNETGYNIHDFWSKYFTGAKDASSDPENWAKFKGVTNIYAMPESQLVIHKVVGFFMGQNVNPEARFCVEIAVRTGNNEPEVIASAICNGSDVENTLGDSYFAADFVFEKPVVLNAEMGDEYIITWSGFDNAGEYVAVMSNYWAPKNGMNHGYAIFDIMQDGALIEDGMLPLEAAIDVPGSFGMMLDAEMPWLVGEDEEIEVGVEAVEVNLNSFYDGEELTIEAPDWIEASVSGRWDNCKLTVTQTAEAASTGKITVSGPGVSYSVDVKGVTGIKALSASELSEIVDAYTMQGARIDSKQMTTGVYIVRLSNGAVRKAVIK